MGLKLSRGSAPESNNREENETAFQHFTNSIRRSIRIKRTNTNASENAASPGQTTPGDVSKQPPRARSGLPEKWTSGSGSTSTASPSTPQSPPHAKVTTPKTPQEPSPITAKAQHSDFTAPPQKSPQDNEEKEVNKAMNLLKDAIATAPSPNVGEKVEQRTDDMQFVDDVLSKMASTEKDEEEEVKTPPTETAPKPAASLLAALKEKKEEEEEEDKAKDSPKSPILAGQSLEIEPKKEEKTEDMNYVEDLLSKMAPADTSKEEEDVKTPPTEEAPKPAAGLLAALEQRKAAKAEADKEENPGSEIEAQEQATFSTGVTNVLETIATGTTAVKSKEAANLLASLAPPSPVSPKSEQGSEGRGSVSEDKS